MHQFLIHITFCGRAFKVEEIVRMIDINLLTVVHNVLLKLFVRLKAKCSEYFNSQVSIKNLKLTSS